MVTSTTTLETTSPFRVVSSTLKSHWQAIAWGLCIFLVLASRMYLMIVRPILFTDESLYLGETSAMFHKGVMVPWAWNPGVAALNMIWYAPFSTLAMGLDYASRLATFITSTASFVLMVAYLRGLVNHRYWGMVAVFLALASVPFWNILLNSSDNYYLVAALLIMMALRYSFEHPPTHWSWVLTSTLIAASTTLRNDGTVVYILTSLVYLWILWRTSQPWWHQIWTAIRIWFLPIGLILAIYWGVAITRGGFYEVRFDSLLPQGTTVSERTYTAFEQGEGRIKRFELQAEGKIWYIDGLRINAELYGTREENDANVFRAIARNPSEWLKRVVLNFRDFYLTWNETFRVHGTLIFVAALWGWALLWHYRPKEALIFLLMFAPVSVYFLLTYWQVRYVMMLTPLLIILSIFTLSVFAHTPVPGERKPSIIAAIIAGISVSLMVYFGALYGNPVPYETTILTVLMFGLFTWRFILQREFSGPLRYGSVVLVTLILIVGTFRMPLSAEQLENPYTNELSDYINHAYGRYPEERVCVGYSDLEASSLLWYTRQPFVPAASDIRGELRSGTFHTTMQNRNCTLALIAHAGWSNPLEKDLPDAWTSVNAEVLFQSDQRSIVLFRLNSLLQ